MASGDEIAALKDGFNRELAKRDLQLKEQEDKFKQLLSKVNASIVTDPNSSSISAATLPSTAAPDSQPINGTSAATLPSTAAPDSPPINVPVATLPSTAAPDPQPIAGEIHQALQDIKVMKNQWNSFSQLLESLSLRMNKQEAYSRLNSLLIHGLLDIPMDKLDRRGFKFCCYIKDKLNELLADKMNFKIVSADIDAAHPLPTRAGKEIVIVKFVSRVVRNQIWYNKKLLNGSNISVSEHLTSQNIALLNDAKDVLGRENAWLNQCVVHIQVNGRKHKIFSKKDLLALTHSPIDAPQTHPSVNLNNYHPHSAADCFDSVFANPDVANELYQKTYPVLPQQIPVQYKVRGSSHDTTRGSRFRYRGRGRGYKH